MENLGPPLVVQTVIILPFVKLVTLRFDIILNVSDIHKFQLLLWN